MKWTSKVMSNNQDQSISKLSNRSLSKFKKVNLQKSEAQIASNEHLEKSILKLTSVQKIKTLNLNRSFISNYLASSQQQSQLNSRAKLTQNPTPEVEKSKQNNFHTQSSQSIQTQYPKILDFSSEAKPFSKQGIGMFQKEKIIDFNIQTQNSQHLSLQQKLEKISCKFQEVFLEFSEISQSIKKQTNSTIASAIWKILEQLSNFTKNFEFTFSNGVQQLIGIIQKQNRAFQIKHENFVKTNQILPPSPENDSFYKIKNFEHEQIEQKQTQKPQSTSRPYKFKNKFKQMIDNSSHENFVTKNQVKKGGSNQNQQQRQRSSTKIMRKQTNPITVTRVNSLFRNESSVLNQDSFSNPNDISTNSIKYCKVTNNRSASKSVKKLHDKLVLIKNIFNSGAPTCDIVPGQQIKILVEHT